LLGGCLTGDLASRQAVLERCDTATYQRVVVPLGQHWVLPAGSVFTPKHMSSCFTGLASYASAEDMVVIGEQMRADLHQLTPFVEYLEANQQTALRDWLIKNRQRTRTLQQALEARIGRAPNFLENLRRRLIRDSSPPNRSRRRR